MDSFQTFHQVQRPVSPTSQSVTYARMPRATNTSHSQVDDVNGRRLSWPSRPQPPRLSFRLESSDEETCQEPIDLLRMCPETQGRDSNTEITDNLENTNLSIQQKQQQQQHYATTQPVCQQQGCLGTIGTPPLQNVTRIKCPTRARLFQDESEDSSGIYDDSGVLYFNSLCTAREPERIAFLSRSYSALDRNQPSNGTVPLQELRQQRSNINVADYCSSPAHSKACGKIPRRQLDKKNKLSRSLKQIYPENKIKQRRRMRRLKRWAFITAILLGIILAITGIIVAFLVFAPLRMGVHHCKVGQVWCGKHGCISPSNLCAKSMECPGPFQDFFCHHMFNKSDYRDFTKLGIVPFTLSPLLRNSDSVYEQDIGEWVNFPGGSANGSRYITIPRPLTFSGAQEACRDQGGHLAHINTVREQAFLEEFLDREIKKNVFSRDTIGFWIGARRARGSHSGTCMYDQWRWIDTHGRTHGTITGFSAFVPDKPDNYYAPEECLFMSINNGYHESRYMKWDDAPCDIHGVGSISSVCEVEFR